MIPSLRDPSAGEPLLGHDAATQSGGGARAARSSFGNPSVSAADVGEKDTASRFSSSEKPSNITKPDDTTIPGALSHSEMRDLAKGVR